VVEVLTECPETGMQQTSQAHLRRVQQVGRASAIKGGSGRDWAWCYIGGVGRGSPLWEGQCGTAARGKGVKTLEKKANGGKVGGGRPG